jgi:hypothetical protein
MLAHPDVNFSMFPAELLDRPCFGPCNRWLQCGSMQIELPAASWAETAHRADDDAHTLTVASHATPDWVHWQLPADPAQSARTQVAATEPVTVTITF